MIALLLACADVPVVEPAAMMVDEPVTAEEAEVVELDHEAQPIVPEVEPETDSEAIQPIDWTESLPPEEQLLIGLLNEAVDEAAERTVEELIDAERIRPGSIPVVGFFRDLAKLLLGLGLAVMLARARRPQVDTAAIAEHILGRADVVARESEVGRLAELDRLRIAHAEARSEIARLRQRPDTSPALPGLEDPEARRLAVEEAGRAALRRRR